VEQLTFFRAEKELTPLGEFQILPVPIRAHQAVLRVTSTGHEEMAKLVRLLKK
jgi:hypothetical protein